VPLWMIGAHIWRSVHTGVSHYSVVKDADLCVSINIQAYFSKACRCLVFS
jgi:hypothetical protein